MIEKIRKSEELIFVINAVVLLAFFVQLFNFPNKAATAWSLLICGIYFLMQKKIVFGIREGFLLLSMFLFEIFAVKNWGQGISIILMPVLFQLIGRYTLSQIQDEKKYLKRIKILLGIFVLGYFIHALLNSGIYLKNGIAFQGRVWEDIWTGVMTPATQHNIYFLPVMAMTFPAVLLLRQHKWLCSAVLAAAGYSIWFSALSQSRTPLVIFAAVLAAEIIIWLFFNIQKKQARKIILVGFIAVLTIVLAGGFFLWLNWNSVQSSALYTVLNRNGGILNNVRFQAQRNVLGQLFEYPFGGYQMDLAGLDYAHNVWLDLANAAGVVPFVFLTIYTLMGTFDLFKLLKSAHTQAALKYVLAGLWLALMLYYTVEPALEATVQFIIPWTFINGLIYECSRVEF